jgi:hypothetical protein
MMKTTTYTTPSTLDEPQGTEYETKEYLQELYDAGKTSQGQDLTETEANEIIDGLGINFGVYEDDLKTAIKGMTRIEAFSYLNSLIGSMDKHDDGSDNNEDFKIDGKKDITNIFKDMGLGKDSNEIGTALKKIGTDVYKDDVSIEATDQEIINAFKQVNNPNAETPALDNKAWVGMLQLQDAFGNTVDQDGNGISDDIDAYNTQNGTTFTEETYRIILDSLENNAANTSNIPMEGTPATPVGNAPPAELNSLMERNQADAQKNRARVLAGAGTPNE